MTVQQQDLASVVAAAFERRAEPVQALAAAATSVALACRDMAARFHTGGRLLVFGNGGSAADAAHIAVEFVHPVIVGKRALPAMSLVGDVATVTGVANRSGMEEVFAHQLRVLGRRGDIALGVSADGNCGNVRAALRAARDAGMLTIALTGGDGGAIAREGAAEHCLTVPSADPRVVKEAQVTSYHVLWELVHVFFDHPEVLAPSAGVAPGGVESLYPFLYGGAGGGGGAAVIEDVAGSTAEKVAEIVSLRRAVGAEISGRLAGCAAELAASFAAGGTLFPFGNGGSSTDAAEVACTFLGGDAGLGGDARLRALPAVCLTNDVAVVTALANDVGFEVVFARQLRAFGRRGDAALAISTSGGSANVLAGVDEANRMGMLTIGLAGYGGGRMAEQPSLDHLFAVPSTSVHRVQELQTTIYHVLWEATLHALAGG